MLAYCDYIAKMIYDNAIPDKSIVNFVGFPKMDLHPTEGYFVSTKKTIRMVDNNGKSYKVTIEEDV